ncbi:MAG: hypothetical protein IPJ65_43980 [Archangiaceae bacterium]|nr:hypothetical protein [Archangiaceae bacterium]
MRRAWGAAWVLWLGCAVHPDPGDLKACDAEHACRATDACVRGVCRPKDPRCVSAPAAEVCDGADNDCNGVVDDVAGCLYTLAGAGPPALADGQGAQARFAAPHFLNADAAGNLYVADTANHALRRIDPFGQVVTLAGDGRCGDRDGAVGVAQLCSPIEAQPAADGSVVFTDRDNHALRRFAAGVVTTLAGGLGPGAQDGPSPGGARFDHPSGLWLLTNGDVLIADTGNARIRRYEAATGQVTTVAGSSAGSADGVRSAVQLDAPADVVQAGDGTLYVSEAGTHRIRKLPVAGSSSTFVGSTRGVAGYAEGSGTASRLARPGQLALATAELLFADGANHLVRAAPLSGLGSTRTVGGSLRVGLANGPPVSAALWQLDGFAFSGSTLYLSDNDRVRATPAAGPPVLADLAGGAAAEQSVDGQGAQARWAHPAGLSAGDDGVAWVVEPTTHLLRAVSDDGTVSTLVGTLDGYGPGDRDGAFEVARLSAPRDVAVGANRQLFVADDGNHRVRRVDLATRTVSTLAGSGAAGYLDGAAQSARFGALSAVAAGADAVLVADLGNFVVRRVALPDGQVSTLCGTPGSPGTVDGAPGVGRLQAPRALAYDASAGVLYVADGARVRRVSSAGVIDSPFAALPQTVTDVSLDGERLLVTTASALYAQPPSGAATLLFSAPFGWRDGETSSAGFIELVGVAASADAVLLLDQGAARVRRLWR